jgi:hypothetical protein
VCGGSEEPSHHNNKDADPFGVRLSLDSLDVMWAFRPAENHALPVALESERAVILMR